MRIICLFLSLLLCRVSDNESKFVSPTRHTDLSSTIIIVEDAKGKGLIGIGLRLIGHSTWGRSSWPHFKPRSGVRIKVICIIFIVVVAVDGGFGVGVLRSA